MRVSRRSVAESGEICEQAAQVAAESSGHELARVLDQDDVGPQNRGVLADAPDQAIAMIVAYVIIGYGAREARARRAGGQDNGPRHSGRHGLADLRGLGDREVRLDGHQPDIGGVGGVAAE